MATGLLKSEMPDHAVVEMNNNNNNSYTLHVDEEQRNVTGSERCVMRIHAQRDILPGYHLSEPYETSLMFSDKIILEDIIVK